MNVLSLKLKLIGKAEEMLAKHAQYQNGYFADPRWKLGIVKKKIASHGMVHFMPGEVVLFSNHGGAICGTSFSHCSIVSFRSKCEVVTSLINIERLDEINALITNANLGGIMTGPPTKEPERPRARQSVSTECRWCSNTGPGCGMCGRRGD